jgi:Protein of unknown function (DUF1207)
MRFSRRYIAAVVVLVTLAAVPAQAAPIADDYIKGYAAAILAREFKVRAPSLQVRGGIVQLVDADLAPADRSAVAAALAGIEGVTRVVILSERPAAGTAPPRPSDVSVVTDAASPGLLEIGLLPGGLLFRPLLADPRWPHFSLGYRQYLDEDDLGAVVAGSIGENLPFYRWTTSSANQWEVGGLALVAPTFDRDNGDDLLAEDYLLGLFLGWRRGALSGIARIFHTSAHIGDELALRGTVRRENLSYETLDARLSWDFASELRLYGGAGYLVRRDPRSLDPWWLQLGLEFRSDWRAWQVLRPVAAIDLQSRQQNDWRPALSLRAGAQFDSMTVLGRSAQFLLEYYTGDSREGQFYTRDVEYVGFGVHFSF